MDESTWCLVERQAVKDAQIDTEAAEKVLGNTRTAYKTSLAFNEYLNELAGPHRLYGREHS